MSGEQWMTEYERAYQSANGGWAKVVICGGGWYRISSQGRPVSNSRLRKTEILEMTARLEQRLLGKSA